MAKELYFNGGNTASYNGFVDDAIRFIENFQLIDPTLWRRFVQQFREDADYDAGWRGEYWGKMMRGAALVYAYTRNPELYDNMVATVKDMMDSADEQGRISSYAVSHEFDGWDMWSRKYVLLGMQYFLEVCEDDKFRAEIIASMCKQVDYIMTKIGDGEGKKQVTAATRHWRGLNSASVLEPIVRLYNLTGEKKYFDFAEYIVNTGCTDIVNIFDLAYEDKLYPYQYPVTKAYEMTSCFEGLLEFYMITGVERYKTSIVNFANKILESDFTVIGSCGCTHELFDHSTVRQANTNNGKIAQETCVTVTLMKFLYRVYMLTGDPKYVDAFEISFYNAYLGAINTDKVIEPLIAQEHPDWIAEPLPFDSYSPLTAGTRGNGIGGLKVMSDLHYYGCCACIGSAGIGLVPKMQAAGFEAIVDADDNIVKSAAEAALDEAFYDADADHHPWMRKDVSVNNSAALKDALSGHNGSVISFEDEINVTESIVADGNVVIDLQGETLAVNGAFNNTGVVTIQNGTLNAGTAEDYAFIGRAGSETTFTNVDVDADGGAVAVVDGAKVTFNSGSVANNGKTTDPRYNFYVVGDGTVLTISGGEFSFAVKTLKRAYIYVGTGATVYVEGGTFGAPSTRSGYTAGFRGDGEIIITGGTFGFDPTAWVADGYEAVKSGSTWTVSAK